MRGDNPSSREKREALAAAARRGTASTGCLNPEECQSKRIFAPDSCGPTLSSGTREGMNIQPSVLCMADDNAKAAIDEDMCGSLKVGGSAPSIAQGRMVVRRLTPMECERLQGFPDNWTKVPYRGKPAEECPDGPRYKAIGNSMAVPVMRWLGERIAMADEIPPEEVEL